ncbi:plasmid maintenance system killer protein [Labrys miyagiensis]|uniref:Plasmid maintenance system killer protein n=2 Tax=Labrys miyagiensis TaxID=346912 RepID=A0ABQ6CT91_9HYPH|nr:type II toxin-antitoxin system RelE/ParE family toxin [Labrys miyagiensis]GLS23349.1 plasmid maintenance system killer protein [Labrys miyagiensis]
MSWANSATQRFAETGKCKFSGLDEEAASDLLAVLDAATSLSDLSPLRSVGLHKLKGRRKEQWAMTINGPWRLCFRFEEGNAWDVEIVDYH